MDETQGFLSNTEPADRQSTNTTGHRASHLQGHAAAAATLPPPLKGGRRETEALHRLISKRTAPFSGLLLDPRLRSPPPLLPSFLPLPCVLFPFARSYPCARPCPAPLQGSLSQASVVKGRGRDGLFKRRKRKEERNVLNGITLATTHPRTKQDGPNGNCGFLQLLVGKKRTTALKG